MVFGCGSTDSSNSGGTAGSGGAGGTGGQDFSPNPPLVIGGDERPAQVDIPTDYDPTVSHPLLMVLHGFGAALWTINDGEHIPVFSTDYADMTTDWLFRHSR